MIGELYEDDDTSLAFEPAEKPVPAEERARLLADPGFGRVFTDHMAIIEYDEHEGWHDARITARKPFLMDPASPVLHYAQEIFEGMKAYRRPGRRRGAVPARRQCAAFRQVGDPPRHASAAGGDVPRIRCAGWSVPTTSGSRTPKTDRSTFGRS